MRRLVLLCLAGLLMTAAVAVASPLIVRPAASRWFAAVRHTNSKSARRRVTHGKGHSRVFRTGRAGLASATSVAVLFGEQTVEPGHGEDFAGRAEAFPFTNSSTGSASSITVYLGYQNRAKALIAGIYADTKGHPGALVASGSLASPKAGTWNSVPIHSVAVTPGTYWVAVLGEGGSIHFRDRSGGVCASQRAGSGDLAALPSSWEAGATQTGCPISAYVVGTLSPSATTTTTTTQTDPTTTTTQTDPAVVTLPPLNTGAPTISGSTVAGDTLTATNGSWANSPTSYGYQWQDCTTGSLGLLCSDISGATGSSYTLANSDVGDTVRVVVTASNAGGSTSAPSAQSGVVTLPPAPANTAAPVVTGSPVEGQTLSSSPGTWSNSPTSYAYAWEDCDSSGNNCTTISGASSSTYTLASSDVGHTIRSIVTATNAGGKTSASSAQTAEVTIPAPGNTGLPAITGQTVQGQTLTTSNGTWTGSPTTYAYAWEDCDTSGNNCTTINGATTSTYTLTSSDVGNTIRSIVTATNTGGSTPATSNPSSTVTSPTPPPANTTAPAITGQTVQGQTLTTSNGTWTGSPTTYAYAWEDCDTSGNNCTTINGATTSTYTLTSSDVGNTIRSIVTATNTGGSTPATSTQTTAVTTNTTSGSGGLPSGVTLRAVDGGSCTSDQGPCYDNYYCTHGFTVACNANGSYPASSWDSMSFFPIAQDYYECDEPASTWLAEGLNVADRVDTSCTPSTLGSTMKNAGLWLIAGSDNYTTKNSSGFGPETVGWHMDEPVTWDASTSTPMSQPNPSITAAVNAFSGFTSGGITGRFLHRSSPRTSTRTPR